MTFTVRFQEFQRYDIAQDAEVVRLMAVTSTGTWWSEVLASPARALRERREAFRQYVFSAMQNGLKPKEIVIG